ncbi:hypothetical protein [Nocardia niwae]|uniref:Uncharacterized protein n=1 Tax=Nocardia niwae TaxID=626084 RepID=A0ABV2XGL2_9NOCA
MPLKTQSDRVGRSDTDCLRADPQCAAERGDAGNNRFGEVAPEYLPGFRIVLEGSLHRTPLHQIGLSVRFHEPARAMRLTLPDDLAHIPDTIPEM